MKIRITNTGSGLKFPYGYLTENEREFIKAFEGEEFTAERVDMNYYKLSNGMRVHIYNGLEVIAEQKENREVLDTLLDQYWGAAYAEGKEGRNHDTEDGLAQQTLCAIHVEVQRLIDCGGDTEGGTRCRD